MTEDKYYCNYLAECRSKGRSCKGTSNQDSSHWNNQCASTGKTDRFSITKFEYLIRKAIIEKRGWRINETFNQLSGSKKIKDNQGFS